MKEIKISFSGTLKIEEFNERGEIDINSLVQKINKTIIIPALEESLRQKVEMDTSANMLAFGAVNQKPIENAVTLEDFGGEACFRYFENLNFNGRLISSSQAIFQNSDLGKSFCGLFNHLNPETPINDLFYPGIKGSRYAIIKKVISPSEIEVDFDFNHSNGPGYIYFDNSLAWEKALKHLQAKQNSVNTLFLGKNKTFVIPEYESIEITSDTFVIGENCNLLIGKEDYFRWSDKKSFKQGECLMVVGSQKVKVGLRVNICPPFRRVPDANPIMTPIFRGQQNPQPYQIILMDCNTNALKMGHAMENICGWGFGFHYDNETLIVGKNINHSGGSFMDFKSPYGRSLTAVFENVKTDFEPEEKYGNTSLKVKGYILNNQFHITSEQTAFQIFTNEFGIGSNLSTILHIGRFTYQIDGPSAVIDGKTIQLRLTPAKGNYLVRSKNSIYSKNQELHAGDILIHQGNRYKVIAKDRSPSMEWASFLNGNDMYKAHALVATLDKELPIEEGWLEFEVEPLSRNLSEQPAFLIYKSNRHYPTTLQTQFGDQQILSSDLIGHLSYNHRQIRLWAKDFEHRGFYRQTAGGKGEEFYCLKGCSGFGNEFNPSVPVRDDVPMPEEASALIGFMNEKIKTIFLE
ncbi:MAG: hypothetical protein EA341_03425 [Mongoliibacter sp.]|uniref:hypothetical protein n=1 Tax=Mongoliibacter sp. TaxID=2022438 RepID=UPI0012F02A55|nr:hypothetical protein [Mongoliibacter sp.]TVP52305.1 MAG: hypothetical protein EA341_03425 [Mongoliibacter sp.]